MLRKGAVSTADQLQAASAEVLRLQEKLKQENSPTPPSAGHPLKGKFPSPLRQDHRGAARNPLRQAFFITVAFAVFWFVATRAINHGRERTIFESITAGDDAAVDQWVRHTPLAEQMAISKREQWTALHAAADSGSHRIVKILLDAGHDANAPDMHKAAPLHRAAASGSLPTVSLLIAAGARLDALDKFGATAYAWAVKYGHQHLLSVLRPDAA